MSALAKLESQWRAFKHDEPGHRFEHQHERMKKQGKGLLVGAAIVGGLLVAAGIVLLFIPGPGLLVSIFGLALVGRLARVLDRIEPPVRRAAKRAKRSWARASTPTKVALITITVALANAAASGAYRVWIA